MKKIKVAIIGQGRSGRSIHGRYFLSGQEKYQVVAVADQLEKRRKTAGELFGCDTYEDYHSLLKRDDIDLVVNASYSQQHVPITLDLLNSRFNVLCEKPLARTVEEVDMLIKASEESEKLLTVFQQSRFAPYFKQVRKVIDLGVLGRIIQISVSFNGFSRRWDWQTFQENYAGSLLNTGPHPLDQALQLFGTDIMPQVKCIMDRVNTFGDAEDYVKIILTGKGRPVIDLEISSCCAYPCFTYNIQGSRGGFKGTMTQADWKYFKADEAPNQKLFRQPLETEDGTPAYCKETLTWYEDSWKVPEEQSDMVLTMTGEYYDMLYRTLTEGTPLEVTLEEVRQQIAVIEECHKQNPLSVLNKQQKIADNK